MDCANDILQEIVNSIAKAVFEHFGESIKIYTEEIKQGFSLPCFFIKLNSASERQGLCDRIKMINEFSVFYFSENKNKNKDINQVLGQLMSVLKSINCKGKIFYGTDIKMEKVSGILLNGMSRSYENSDGVLCMHINYDFYIKYFESVPVMERLKLKKDVDF